MTYAVARSDPPCADHGDGVVVRRPRASDAVGNALRKAFLPDQAMPCDLLRSLDALDAGR